MSQTDPPGALAAYIDGFGAQFAAAMRAAEPQQHGGAPSPEPARPPRKKPRRLLRPAIGFGGLAVASAIAVAIVLFPVGDKIDVVQEARAALGTPGEIIHYQVKSGPSSFQGSTASNTACDQAPPIDIWQTASGTLRQRIASPGMDRGCGIMSTGMGQMYSGRTESSIDGTTSAEYIPFLKQLDITTGRDTGRDASSFGMPNQGSTSSRDLVMALRTMLGSGELIAVGGSRTENGRRVLSLRGSAHHVNGKGQSRSTVDTVTTYVVDAENFTPIRYQSRSTSHYEKGNGRPSGGSFDSTFSSSFPLYERLPLNAETEKLLTIQPAPGTTITTETEAKRNADALAYERRQSAEGHRNAERAHARAAAARDKATRSAATP